MGSLVTLAIYFTNNRSRSIAFTDLSKAQTQTVSVAFLPNSMRWAVSGDVQGTGTLVVSYKYSNQLSGTFSVKGGGDYYDTNVTMIFIPEGQAKGKIKGSFRLSRF